MPPNPSFEVKIMEYKAIAIDGPSGAGKSTLAKKLAEKLDFIYVDTGAIYRTVGLAVKRRGLDPGTREQVLPLLPTLKIELGHGEDGTQRMYLDGEDVTAAIRDHEISHYASAVSALPEVRDFLMETQRSMARSHHVIMDGRDIGTVVLPNAHLKIFLTAAPEARARRRFLELQTKGSGESYEQVLADMIRRDHDDSTRKAAPLRQAEDGILVDTTELDLEGSLDLLLELAKERLG